MQQNPVHTKDYHTAMAHIFVLNIHNCAKLFACLVYAGPGHRWRRQSLRASLCRHQCQPPQATALCLWGRLLLHPAAVLPALLFCLGVCCHGHHWGSASWRRGSSGSRLWTSCSNCWVKRTTSVTVAVTIVDAYIARLCCALTQLQGLCNVNQTGDVRDKWLTTHGWASLLETVLASNIAQTTPDAYITSLKLVCTSGF